MSEPNITVTHDEEVRRYYIDVDGKRAGYAAYVPAGEGILDFDHTVIDPAFRGQGLSSPLIRYALDDAGERGYKIIPSCSAIAHFLNKNEGYRDLAVD